MRRVRRRRRRSPRRRRRRSQQARRAWRFASWPEAVADAPDGLDEPRVGRVGLELGPQPADVDGDGRGVEVEAVLPDVFHQLVAGECLSWMSGEEQQKLELELG